ncbi:hypothetical protein ACF1BQ_018850 [Bradyrhizobium sp. RDT10]
MGELAQRLAAKFGADRLAKVTWDPVADLERALGALPRLVTATADRLGLRRDGDVTTLVANVLDDMSRNPF